MSTTARHADAVSAADLESAGFVRLLARADGDALAASGLLARAMAEREIPFQVSVTRTIAERTTRAAADNDSDLTVSIGAVDGDALRLDPSDRPLTHAALEIVREIGTNPEPLLALAGTVAAGVDPDVGETEALYEQAREDGRIERRPGVAVPTAEPVDGLAHSTRLRAPWSGDLEATRDALADVDLEEPLDDETRRDIGSLVAIDVVGAETATQSAARAVGRALSPHETGAETGCATLEGYADILEATARIEPGTGVALAIGHDAYGPALDAWRAYGERTHDALDAASTKRYDGVTVVSIDDDAVVESVAELAGSYTTLEPVTLAVGDGQAGIAIEPASNAADRSETASPGSLLEATVRALADDGISCEYDVTRRGGTLRYDQDVDEPTVIDAIRGQL